LHRAFAAPFVLVLDSHHLSLLDCTLLRFFSDTFIVSSLGASTASLFLLLLALSDEYEIGTASPAAIALAIG